MTMRATPTMNTHTFRLAKLVPGSSPSPSISEIKKAHYPVQMVQGRFNMHHMHSRERARLSCPFRKSYPDVLVVQSSQDGNGANGARSLDCSMQLAAQGADQTFGTTILPRRPRRDRSIADTHRPHPRREDEPSWCGAGGSAGDRPALASRWVQNVLALEIAS